jgi:hypothetical protein
MQVDHSATWNFYQETVDRIDALIDVPGPAVVFRDVLTRYVDK